MKTTKKEEEISFASADLEDQSAHESEAFGQSLFAQKDGKEAG